jgi:regulator of replication initiation timing
LPDDDSDNGDIDDVLKAKLTDLEEEVKSLRLQQQKLENFLQEPVECKSLADKKGVTTTQSPQKDLLQLENNFLLKKLMIHRLSGTFFFIVIT